MKFAAAAVIAALAASVAAIPVQDVGSDVAALSARDLAFREGFAHGLARRTGGGSQGTPTINAPVDIITYVEACISACISALNGSGNINIHDVLNDLKLNLDALVAVVSTKVSLSDILQACINAANVVNVFLGKVDLALVNHNQILSDINFIVKIGDILSHLQVVNIANHGDVVNALNNLFTLEFNHFIGDINLYI